MRARRFQLTPATASGRAAGWLALAAVAALLLGNTLFADASGLREAVRVASILTFLASSVAALVLSLRGLAQGDRGGVVWMAAIVGALATLFLLLELTVWE